MNITTKLLIVSIFFFVIYDLIVMAISGREATISYDVLALSHQHPVIPLAVGIILGHLFWPQQP
jgi:hypothetical protein